MLTTEQINELNQDPLGAFLVKQLDRAYAAGGEEAVVEKLKSWGMTNNDPLDNQSAQLLAEMWIQGGNR